jgi:hypothetical protein
MDTSEDIKSFRYFIKILNYKNLYNLTGNILIKGCKLRLMSFSFSMQTLYKGFKEL